MAETPWYLESCSGRLFTNDDSLFYINKKGLSRKSEYFRRLFYGPFGIGRKEFLIPGIRGDTLEVITVFLYFGKVNITDSNVYELLIAADYLLVEDLIAEIKNVRLTVTNCLPIFLAALKIDRKDIVQECFRYILTHFGSVAASDSSWLSQMPQQVLEQFLGHRSLCVTDESATCAVVQKWIEADVENSHHLLPCLMNHIAPFVTNPERLFGSDAVTQNNTNDVAVLKTKNSIENLTSYVGRRYDTVEQRGHSTEESTDMGTSKLWIPSFSITSRISSWIPSFLKLPKRNQSVLPPMSTNRKPSYLYFILHYWIENAKKGVHVYSTYDEDIDLWRKIFEIDGWPNPKSFFALKQDIYMLHRRHGALSDPNITLMRYNLIEKELILLPEPRIPLQGLMLMALNGQLYAMCISHPLTDRKVSEVKVYSREENDWHDVSPMFPVTCAHAKTMDGKIYVVGKDPNDTSIMVAQSYSPETNTWTLLQPPLVVRSTFDLVGHRGLLYVVGGADGSSDLEDIEVFDPKQQQWFNRVSPVHDFESLRVMDLVEELTVHEDRRQVNELDPDSAWMWDKEQKCWKSFDRWSPARDVYHYSFVLVDDEECVRLMTKENRDPETEFKKSPFA